MNAIKTSDLYLASFVSFKIKTLPTLEMQDGRVIFTFKSDPPVLDALNSFNSDESIGSFSFANTIKQVRTAMIRRKSDGGLNR